VRPLPLLQIDLRLCFEVAFGQFRPGFESLTPVHSGLVLLTLSLESMPQVQQGFGESRALRESFAVEPDRVVHLATLLQEQTRVPLRTWWTARWE